MFQAILKENYIIYNWLFLYIEISTICLIWIVIKLNNVTIALTEILWINWTIINYVVYWIYTNNIISGFIKGKWIVVFNIVYSSVKLNITTNIFVENFQSNL